MSIERPTPNNPINPIPRNTSPLGPLTPGKIIGLALIGLLAGLFIGKYTFKSNDCLSTPLWGGKFVKAVVYNQATEAGERGLMKVNLSDKYKKDRYFCLYEFNSIERKLGGVYYIKANSLTSIPIATEIQEDPPSESDLYTGEPTTSINEHSSHQHGAQQGVHRKSHIKPGVVAATFNIGRSGAPDFVVTTIHPLHQKTSSIYNDNTPDPDGEVEVFIDFVSDDLVYIDRCHYHFGENQGCIED